MSDETRENKDGCDHGANTPQSDLQVQTFEGSALSSITPRSLGTPEKVRLEKTSFHIGLPPTPPLRELNMPNLSILEEGYDRDIHMDPFVQSGVEDEVFVDMNETGV